MELLQKIKWKYMPPGGFFGIQILPNSISAGTPSQTPLWSLGRSPDLVSWRGDTPSHSRPPWRRSVEDLCLWHREMDTGGRL